MGRRIVGIIGLVLLTSGGLIGCAPVMALPQNDPALARLQDFANRTASAYRLWVPTHVTWGGTGGEYFAGNIRLHPAMQHSRILMGLFAHELGHRVLYHLRSAPENEMAANAKGVEILVRIGDLHESEALREMYLYLREARGKNATGYGHATPCAEITDLLARFPQHRALWQSWECAPAAHPTSSQDRGTASGRPGSEGGRSAGSVGTSVRP